MHVVNHRLRPCIFKNTYLNEGRYLRKTFRAIYISLLLHKETCFIYLQGVGRDLKRSNINKRKLLKRKLKFSVRHNNIW